MPSALILLFIVLVFVAILTWFIPTSVITTDEKTEENIICYNASFDENGDVVRGTGTAPVGIWDVFMAPIKGFADGADVNFSILISGAFLAILNFLREPWMLVWVLFYESLVVKINFNIVVSICVDGDGIWIMGRTPAIRIGIDSTVCYGWI